MSAKSDINVTPLIDIVLVLLIVFIVMVPGMSKQLSVVVPQVRKVDKIDTPKNQPPPLVLEVEPTADNTNYVYKFQSEALEITQIPERLVPVVQLQPVNMRKVFLKIDEEVPYQVAVQVLDQVRKASDIAKRETMKSKGIDGGDTRVAISLKTRKS